MVLLLVIRQYEGKRSYRLFVDWLVEEAYYLRMNRSPVITTYTTFHYSSEIHGKNHRYRSKRIISSFAILTKIGQLLFIGIDSQLMLHNTSILTGY
ncbi:MAG: hypothetical protein WCF06_05040 [Nitrososphaeraceae archaeon]